MAWTFYNSTGEILTNFGPVALTDLDIDGGTDIGAAIVDADLFIVDDNASGTNRKTAASRLTTYIAANMQANQAALEAETNEDTYAAPDMIKYSPGVVKAWAQMSGAGSAGQKHRNVATTGKNSTGNYDVTLTTAVTSTDYAVWACCQGDADNTASANGISTTVYRLYTRVGGTLTDLTNSSGLLGDH